MILRDLFCPNCNSFFVDRLDLNQRIQKCSFGKNNKFGFDLINIPCHNCKKEIVILMTSTPILWLKDQQYSYDKFVINKNRQVINYKTYLYFYYPTTDKNTIINLKRTINFEKIDALIIPECFKPYFDDWEKQLCLLPDYLFQPIKNTDYPNYFAQAIIQKEIQKYDNSIVYSMYYNYLDFFILLYKQKEFN